MSQHFSTIGQIATEPRLFTPQGGAEFCTFRLASSERRYDAAKQEWVDTDPNWFTVNAFRSLALHTHASFRKGDRVVLTGRLRVRQWETDSKRGVSVDIDADGIGHDVRWGVSAFSKSVAASTDAPAAVTSEAGSPEPATPEAAPEPGPGPEREFSADGFTPNLETA